MRGQRCKPKDLQSVLLPRPLRTWTLPGSLMQPLCVWTAACPGCGWVGESNPAIPHCPRTCVHLAMNLSWDWCPRRAEELADCGMCWIPRDSAEATSTSLRGVQQWCWLGTSQCHCTHHKEQSKPPEQERVAWEW